MSGLDEVKQKDEQKIRVFFNITTLQKALSEGDFEAGEILFLDESMPALIDTQDYRKRLANFKSYGRAEKLMILNNWGVLEETIKTIRRLGLKVFRKGWFGLDE